MMNRRSFLETFIAGTAVAGVGGLVRPSRGLAQALGGASSTSLGIVSRTIEVNGRAASVFGLLQADGTHGLRLQAGSEFDVLLTNEIGEPTIVHWHGLTPPWDLDGVADNPLPLIEANEVRHYAFPVGAGGTHWMHAHTLQEQNLLAAPLIVRTAADLERDEQEVVILLHDFSFTSAEELLEQLKDGGGHAMPMDHSAMGSRAMAQMPMDGMQGMPMAMMDLNDIDYDAYLANDRTLEDPEVVQVERGGRVRLRVINGATATGFTIDTGSVEAAVIAVDGKDVEPISGRTFPISMGQRLDIRLSLPPGGGAYPILALREGEPERTGVILATPGAEVRRLPTSGEAAGPIVGISLEQRLRAVEPLRARPADRRFGLTLTGQMMGYEWGIQGADDLRAKIGERIEISMRNMSMMSHPMHLHGHHFQVTNINGVDIVGAVRDTILIPPMSMVTVGFDADNPGNWPLHCHHLYHMATGMMAHVAYEDMG